MSKDANPGRPRPTQKDSTASARRRTRFALDAPPPDPLSSAEADLIGGTGSGLDIEVGVDEMVQEARQGRHELDAQPTELPTPSALAWHSVRKSQRRLRELDVAKANAREGYEPANPRWRELWEEMEREASGPQKGFDPEAPPPLGSTRAERDMAERDWALLSGFASAAPKRRASTSAAPMWLGAWLTSIKRFFSR